MMKLLAIFSLLLSGLLYLWLAAIFFYPLYFYRWDEWLTELASQSWRLWAMVAGIAITATTLLGLGVSLLGKNPTPESGG